MDDVLLSVHDVRKRFRDLEAVAGLSFEVRRGDVFGFLGPNGAGKTTTLRMIMGITRPDTGAVRFEGGDRLERRRVGYLPEERGLYEDATVLDTLVYLGTLRGMSRADARGEGRRWLERFELGERARSKVGTLSKGNQQKVQFAGAVLHRPALAVLDEPFSGLDPLNQELFLDLIRELAARGTGVLISAHQLNLVERMADRFLLIAQGRALLSGTLEEVRKLAGGSRVAVTLLLRPRDGRMAEGLPARLAATLADTGVQSAPGPGGAVALEVDAPEGADLGPLLAEAARHGAIERVTTHTLSLHEIYVRAVRGGRPAPEEAAHAQA